MIYVYSVGLELFFIHWDIWEINYNGRTTFAGPATDLWKSRYSLRVFHTLSKLTTCTMYMHWINACMVNRQVFHARARGANDCAACEWGCGVCAKRAEGARVPPRVHCSKLYADLIALTNCCLLFTLWLFNLFLNLGPLFENNEGKEFWKKMRFRITVGSAVITWIAQRWMRFNGWNKNREIVVAISGI